ncbi:MAG: hypothetical protein CVU90_15625 [Firmicutes bacterium HGW-Firmicutes-15]|nr:MAG: hypothetical protein CVU90_15625 [Firmicutes bacterium HGW-Firmicutes-15]
MKCPNCSQGFSKERLVDRSFVCPVPESERGFQVEFMFCPECHHPIVVLQEGKYSAYYGEWNRLEEEVIGGEITEDIIYPGESHIINLPSEIPNEYQNIFKEAKLVLPYSSQASAALSRKGLQQVLHYLEIKDTDLYKEIDKYIEQIKPPTYILNYIHAIRQIGNMAVHPWRNKISGEIIEVTLEEAELSLAIFETILDFHFIQPEKTKEMLKNTNAKLVTAGKPPIKFE